MGDGFGSAGLLHQLVFELQQNFPEILSGKQLVQVDAVELEFQKIMVNYNLFLGVELQV